jgi:uncharacterized integral membrane protein
VTTPDPRPTGPGSHPTVDPLAGPSTPPPTGTTQGPAATAPGAPAPSAPGATPPGTRPSRRAGRTIGRTLALGLLIFVTVVLVLFVVFNTQTVDISLVFVDVEAPLVLALLIAAVLGGLVVGLLDAVMTLRGRRRNR